MTQEGFDITERIRGEKTMSKNYKFETLQVHAGQEHPDPATDARAVPIYATTSYVFKDSAQAAGRFGLTEGGNIYSRLMNPTSSVFEERVAALEGGAAALATATGSAAITYAVQNIATAGDHIVSSAHVYGGTYNLFANTLKEQGISVTFVDHSDPENFRKAIQPNTKLLYGETLGNPNSDVLDLEAVSAVAHENGIPLIVDSTFATPFLLRPLEHGADIVVHSATKFMGGHGSVMGGVIVDGGKFDWTQNDKFPGLTTPDESYHGVVYTEQFGKAAYITKCTTQLMRDLGSIQSPMNAFLLNLGLETLHLRMPRHCSNALTVAKFLKSHPKIESVRYPGLEGDEYYDLAQKYMPNGTCGVISLRIKGGREDAVRFMDSLKLAAIVTHVADSRTCCLHPASTTHRQLTAQELDDCGVYENLVRLSVGTENVDDIISDLDAALANV